MKHNSILIFTFLSLMLSAPLLFAQSPSDIEVMTYTDGQRVLVRWLPTDYDTWLKGNEHGYQVVRLITHENDSLLDYSTMISYKKTLFEHVKPYSESLWSRLYENDSTYAHIAKMLLYQDDPTISNPGNPTFADAYEITNNNEIRHLFALFAADQDFEIARYMALGYEDPCLEGPDFTYQYIISLNDPDTSNDVIKGYSDQIRINTPTVLPAPEITSVSEVKKGVISWSPPSYEQFYGSYDIEKSSNGQDFVQINKLPFVHVTEVENPTQIASYDDSLDIGETAYYRILGRTPFGLQGVHSNIVMATGRAPRMPIFISVDTIMYTLSDTQATIDWSGFDMQWQDSINGFNIHLSEYSNSGFEKINTNMIHATSRTFDLAPSHLSQYVKIEVVDFNGYSYLSPSALVQPADIIPPATPVGLTGTFLDEKRIELIWEANGEPDLKGYRVFVANSRDKAFTQITNFLIDIPVFYYDIEEEMEVDSVYFKILAADHRQNNSEYSELLALARPDIFPPRPPNLYRVAPGLNGVELAWNFSTSEDRVKHVVQRKLSETPLWVDVIEIPLTNEQNYLANQTPSGPSETHFIDTTTLNIMEYEYRMLAYDDQDNMSGSLAKTVTPYDDGLRGLIDSIVVWAQYYQVTDTIPDSLCFIRASNIIDAYYVLDTLHSDSLRELYNCGIITITEHDSLILLPGEDAIAFILARVQELWGAYIGIRVVVQWHYDKLHALDKFELHRGIDGSTVQLYESFDAAPVHHHRFYDEDTGPGWICQYSILALHSDGGFSNMSPILDLTLPAN